MLEKDQLKKYRQGGWRRKQYRNIIIAIVILMTVFVVVGVFAPGGLAALAAAGPALFWLLLLISSALWGLELGLLLAIRTLVSREKYQLEGNPEARLVLYSRLVIVLGLLLGAITLPFLVASFFPGLLLALAATTASLIAPWLILALIGMATALVILLIIAGILNLEPPYNFMREFFGSLRPGAVAEFKRYSATEESLNADQPKIIVLSASEFKMLKPGSNPIGKQLIDYRQDQEPEFFVAIIQFLKTNYSLTQVSDNVKSDEKTSPSYNEVGSQAKAVLKALRELAGFGGHHYIPSCMGAFFVALDSIMQNCRELQIDQTGLELVAEKLGQYKAAVISKALNGENPAAFINLKSEFALSGNLLIDSSQIKYQRMLVNIPLESLRELNTVIDSKLPTPEQIQASLQAQRKYSSFSKERDKLAVAVKGQWEIYDLRVTSFDTVREFREAIDQAIAIKQSKSSSDVNAFSGS